MEGNPRDKHNPFFLHFAFDRTDTRTPILHYENLRIETVDIRETINVPQFAEGPINN